MVETANQIANQAAEGWVVEQSGDRAVKMIDQRYLKDTQLILKTLNIPATYITVDADTTRVQVPADNYNWQLLRASAALNSHVYGTDYSGYAERPKAIPDEAWTSASAKAIAIRTHGLEDPTQHLDTLQRMQVMLAQEHGIASKLVQEKTGLELQVLLKPEHDAQSQLINVQRRRDFIKVASGWHSYEDDFYTKTLTVVDAAKTQGRIVTPGPVFEVGTNIFSDGNGKPALEEAKKFYQKLGLNMAEGSFDTDSYSIKFLSPASIDKHASSAEVLSETQRFQLQLEKIHSEINNKIYEPLQNLGKQMSMRADAIKGGAFGMVASLPIALDVVNTAEHEIDSGKKPYGAGQKALDAGAQIVAAGLCGAAAGTVSGPWGGVVAGVACAELTKQILDQLHQWGDPKLQQAFHEQLRKELVGNHGLNEVQAKALADQAINHPAEAVKPYSAEPVSQR